MWEGGDLYGGNRFWAAFKRNRQGTPGEFQSGEALSAESNIIFVPNLYKKCKAQESIRRHCSATLLGVSDT